MIAGAWVQREASAWSTDGHLVWFNMRVFVQLCLNLRKAEKENEIKETDQV